MSCSSFRVVTLVVLTVLSVSGSTAFASPMINGTFVPTTAEGATASSSYSGLCILCSISDKDNVVNPYILQSARISIPVGVAASARIRVDLAESATSGSAAGFVVRDGTGLLDLTVFQRLTVRTLLDGQVQDERTGASLLNVTSLGAGRFSFMLRATESFDALELEIQGLVSALTAFDVLYAAVRAPVATSVLMHQTSNGASFQTASGALCLGCSVIDPEYAIDDTYRTGARISVPIGVLSAQTLMIDFGQTVPARSRTGFIVERGAGLIDATVLNRITVRTLLDGSLIRELTGSDLSVINYEDGRSFIWVRNAAPTDQAEISMSGALSLLTALDVFGVLTVMPNAPSAADDGIADLAMAVDVEQALGAPMKAGFGPADVAAERGITLGAASPNPATSTARVTLDTDGEPARVALYDALGRQVALLHEGAVASGGESLVIDAAAVPAGTYVIVATTSDGRESRRMTVVR